MIEFEKISDTFEDGFDKVKDFTKKNKVLVIAIGVVGAYALYKLYTRKNTSEDTEYVSTYAYVPTAYDGYPTMSESVSFDDVVEQMRTETSDINEDFYHEVMSDVTDMIEQSQSEMNSKYENIVSSNNNYREDLTTLSYLEEQREKEIKAKMQANSEAWHTASDEEKKRLEAENQAYGSILGADFDSASGTWSKDGESLYNVPNKNKTNTSTAELTNVVSNTSSGSKSVSTSTKNTNTNNDAILSQMQANSKAWHSASASEKKRLEAENKALGSSLGADFDSASGTWSKNGNKLY